MAFDPTRGHAALRRGRISTSRAEYFLTICVDGRCEGLEKDALAEAVIHEMRLMEIDGTWAVRCATVMPDHLHLIVVLGWRLTLGQAVQRMKARTAATLRTAGLKWAHDFFDRQLRAHDKCRPLFLYLYLNPYRKGLILRDRVWPWFVCHPDDWSWLCDLLDQDLPPPEWLE